MNPHQKNKVDISSLTADEQRLFRLYGKLPTKSDLLQNKLKERKYFDSGDYALSKAGKASDTGVTTIGSEHPQPGHIPHLSANSPPGNNHPASAVSPGGPGSEGSMPQLPHHRSSASTSNGSGSFGAAMQSRSPVKEGTSFLARSASITDNEEAIAGDDIQPKTLGHAAEMGDLRKNATTTGGGSGAIPIRR